MKGSPISEAKSPVLIELVRLLDESMGDLGSVDDVDLYEWIVFAVAHQYSSSNFHERLAPDLDDAEALLRDRLSQGWFGQRPVPAPQAWFNAEGLIGDVVLRTVTNDLVIGEKPPGALWTSSFLPDGRSAWAIGESSAYPNSSRRLFAMDFDQAATRAFEVSTPEDYQRLVTRYPRPMPDGRALVDWIAAGTDLDAVRLTAAGLVFAHNVRVPTPYGVAQLRGWDAESTAWLNRPPGLRISDPSASLATRTVTTTWNGGVRAARLTSSATDSVQRPSRPGRRTSDSRGEVGERFSARSSVRVDPGRWDELG
jgi:hypothetical protein